MEKSMTSIREIGALVLDGVPDIPEALKNQTLKYQHSRTATFSDWVPENSVLNGGMLILTRFAETSQVHHVQRAGGNRRQLTFFPNAVQKPKFCPSVNIFDGFIFQKDTNGDEFFQLYSYDVRTGDIKLMTDGKSKNEHLLWSKSGDKFVYTSTQRTGKDYDIILRSGNNFETSIPLIESGGGLWVALSWSSDDSKIIVQKMKSANESYLYILDVATKKLFPINENPEHIAYGFAKFDPTPERNGIFLASDEGSDFINMKYLDISSNSFIPLVFNDNGKSHDLKDINWDVEFADVFYSKMTNKTHLAFVVNEDGVSCLYTANVSDKILTKHNTGLSVMNQLKYSRYNTEPTLAFGMDSPTAPADVFVATNNEKEQWTFSEMGGLQSSSFSTPSLIRYPTFDGRTISAFMYLPTTSDPNTKIPTLLYIHGGPEMQSRPNFNPIFQYIVKELGIALIIPNVRGSSGYGKQFLLLDNWYKREDSVKDIGSLIDWVNLQSNLDSSKLGVYGRSYGGYMVLASLIHFGDRLKCGVEMVGISNFVTFLENTQAYRRDLRREEYGDERIPEMREFLLKISPSTNAHKLIRPMYVSQGLNDPRVPKTESDQIVEAARKNGVDVWYVLAKDEGHAFAKKANIDFHNNLLLHFLQEKLIK